MFYDLNIQWTSPKDPELPRILAFLSELGYGTVALNHTIIGKLPATLASPIPIPLPFATPPSLKILRRLTLSLSTPLSNARLKSLASDYDILALRPIDEKSLQQACSTLECDIISLDLSQRLGYHFKFKPLSEAIKRGIRFEISYSQGLLGDATARRNVISNATQLIRATRSRGLLASSEAKRAVGLRGPWDVVNLLAVWGLRQEIAYEAVSKEARSVVVQAEFKKSGWRGVVDVVYGGEDAPKNEDTSTDDTTKVNEVKAVPPKVNGVKRKAQDEKSTYHTTEEAPVSKREMKRRAKRAKDDAPVTTSDASK